ncbi:hypothetical protein LXA43DRAFT_1068174 [Ganoderma leucocontextum]|nr:hypothetical protein LXA43DRAFT_1068172 [Ganoderma leucocontextum]KAI1782910.1 hypothetical protein LXA43DRAFT_1068174 [Ganoderma leucocontextum]
MFAFHPSSIIKGGYYPLCERAWKQWRSLSVHGGRANFCAASLGMWLRKALRRKSRHTVFWRTAELLIKYYERDTWLAENSLFFGSFQVSPQSQAGGHQTSKAHPCQGGVTNFRSLQICT